MKKILLISLFLAFAIPQFTLAAWWNPFSWDFSEKPENVVNRMEVKAPTIITIQNGENRLDLNADGVQDLVLKLLRSNGSSPHQYSTYTFGTFASSTNKYSENKSLWREVPIHRDLKAKASDENVLDIWNGTSDTYRDFISTSEGADGSLLDIRLLVNDNSGPILVIARRDFGESYADSESVNFDFYTLQKNSEDDWISDYYYDYKTTVSAKKKYVDVEVALDKELMDAYYLARSVLNN